MKLTNSALVYLRLFSSVALLVIPLVVYGASGKVSYLIGDITRVLVWQFHGSDIPFGLVSRATLCG